MRNMLYTDFNFGKFFNKYDARHPYEIWMNSPNNSNSLEAFNLIEKILSEYQNIPIIQEKIKKLNTEILDLQTFYTFLTEIKVANFLKKKFGVNFIPEKKNEPTPDLCININSESIYVEINTRLKTLPYVLLLENNLNILLKNLKISKFAKVKSNDFLPKAKINKDNFQLIFKLCKERIINGWDDPILFKDNELNLTVEVINGISYSERINGNGLKTFEVYLHESLDAKNGKNNLDKYHPNILWTEVLYQTDFQLIEHDLINIFPSNICFLKSLDAQIITICSFNSDYGQIDEHNSYLILNESRKESIKVFELINSIYSDF